MSEVKNYKFDLEAARKTLAQNPLHIDKALNEGFKAHTQEIELPGFGQAKRSMFEFFEKELFTPDNLNSFRREIENDKLGLSKTSQRSLQKSPSFRKKTEESQQELDSILDQIDLAIRQTLLDKYCPPINKIIENKKDRVHQMLQDFLGYVPPGQERDTDVTVEDAIKTCKEQAKEGFINMSSTFLGLVRIIPRVLKRQGEKLSEQDFVKAIHNLKNLLKRYASTHVLKLRIFRNYVGFDDSSEILSRSRNGTGTTRFPVDRSNINQTPDLYHFHQDLFDLIDTHEGKQLVNNEKLLEGYREIIEDHKIRGKEINKGDKDTIQEIMKQMFTTPTLGCPLGRVKFPDQKNFIEIAFNWMESLINKYYMPVARNQGLFKK